MARATSPDHVVLAVIVRGIDAPCQVSRVSEVLAWMVPLFGDSPGIGIVDLRCPCPTLPPEVERCRDEVRARRSIVGRLSPGRRRRLVRLDLADTEAREAFCQLAPWSDDARVMEGRKHTMALGGGTRSFWIELPRDKADDLHAWFRRRGIGKLIDMDEWAEQAAPPPRRRSRRRS
jgi:hypothetical protein